MMTQSNMIQYNATRPAAGRCGECRIGPRCLGIDASASTRLALDSVVRPDTAVPQGTELFTEGSRFGMLYTVRSGCVKTSVLRPDGSEQVLGFHFPGDIVGFDAIDGGTYRSTATAVGSASYCAFPFSSLSQLASDDEAFQRRLFGLMSRAMAEATSRTLEETADQRVAGFLLWLSKRNHARGFSASHFILAMPRRDIANYLRLATETVSRVVTRFQQDGLIRASRREVELLDFARLAQVAG